MSILYVPAGWPGWSREMRISAAMICRDGMQINLVHFSVAHFSFFVYTCTKLCNYITHFEKEDSFMRHLLSPLDFSVEELDQLMDLANDIEAHPSKYSHACEGKKIATLFYEPSTRTRLSFEAAMLNLGGSVLGFLRLLPALLPKAKVFLIRSGLFPATLTSVPCAIPRRELPWLPPANPAFP